MKFSIYKDGSSHRLHGFIAGDFCSTHLTSMSCGETRLGCNWIILKPRLQFTGKTQNPKCSAGRNGPGGRVGGAEYDFIRGPGGRLHKNTKCTAAAWAAGRGRRGAQMHDLLERLSPLTNFGNCRFEVRK